MKPLTTGSKAADFTLLDENGKNFNLYKALKAGPMVLYFYPKDETYGCTKEACSFRDQFEVFKDGCGTKYNSGRGKCE